ncbi:MAG TPA: hypothetical protein VHH34_06240 [Pseudonocardiaceae bacterium]|nr:hypothetical protein [Pseudonocardiaceae bacterium]
MSGTHGSGTNGTGIEGTGPEDRLTSEDPAQAPLTLQLLADLHAGVFDERVAAQLHRRAAADSRAREILAALDATVADLNALPQQHTPPIPDAVAARLDAAVAAEMQRAPTPAPADLSARRSRRTGRAGWAGLAILAAAAATGVVALSGLRLETAGTPQANDALGSATGVRSPEPFTLTRTNLGGALDQALKARDYGPLAQPQLLRNCLAANGVSGGGQPLGALEVTLDGRPGVLLVLPTGRIAQVRLLVVGPDCGPDDPAHLADYVVGR